jgi:hypothetical protein
MSDQLESNTYTVRATQTAGGWEVQILDDGGEVVFARSCGDEEEARTFASTVQQHIYWLSPPKFRAYYRIGEDGSHLDAEAVSEG